MLSSWLTVSPGSGVENSTYTLQYSSDTPTWNIPIVRYVADTLVEYKWLSVDVPEVVRRVEKWT